MWQEVSLQRQAKKKSSLAKKDDKNAPLVTILPGIDGGRWQPWKERFTLQIPRFCLQTKFGTGNPAIFLQVCQLQLALYVIERH